MENFVRKKRERLFAAIFAFTLGTFGINEFYVGNKATGILEAVLSVLLCWTIIVPALISLINLIEGCRYLWCESDDEFMRKFCR